jgi:hypothetical protein
MNMNLKFNLDPKTILPMLRKAQPYIVGILLIGVFAYTAYVVNQALNVAPAAAPSATIPKVSISFDKKTIDSVKSLNVVSGQVPASNLGKTDPFGN